MQMLPPMNIVSGVASRGTKPLLRRTAMWKTCSHGLPPRGAPSMLRANLSRSNVLPALTLHSDNRHA